MEILKRWLSIAIVLCPISYCQLRAAEIVVVVLDDSGSMKQPMRGGSGNTNRMEAAKQALLRVIRTLPDDTQLGVLRMNGDPRTGKWVIPLGVLDRSPKLEQTVRAIQANGGTPLGASMKQGMDELLRLRTKQVYGSYRLLVVTDGEASDPKVLQNFLPDMISRGILVDVIGVDMAGNHSLATRAHSYRRADDAASIEKALADVFAESRVNDGQAGASDFDLIASLPDEFAKEALVALAVSNNALIGDPKPSKPADPSESQPPANSPNSPLSPNGVPPTNGPRAGDVAVGIISLSFGTICCLGTLGVIVVLVIVIMNAGKKGKK